MFLDIYCASFDFYGFGIPVTICRKGGNDILAILIRIDTVDRPSKGIHITAVCNAGIGGNFL